MQVPTGLLVSTGFVLVCVSMCCSEPISSSSETMARPTRPKVFTSPDELKTYLEQLGNFYAIAGRPRFGKRTLAPWMANYFREEPEVLRGGVPISNTDWLQILSSVAQNAQNQDK